MITPLSTFEEAQSKIGDYIEYYNFKRPHQGIGNMTPSDRYFHVDGQVKQLVDENTAKVEEKIVPAPDYTAPDYIVGKIGGKELRVVAKDAEVTLRDAENKSIESGGSDGHDHDGGSGDGKASEGKVAEPGGAPGAGAAGPDSGADGGSAVPPVGSVEGAVLPVAETGPRGAAEGAGSQEAGAQAGSAEHELRRDPGDAGADEAPREGAGADAQGVEPLEGQPGGGAAGDPPQRLESGEPPQKGTP